MVLVWHLTMENSHFLDFIVSKVVPWNPFQFYQVGFLKITLMTFLVLWSGIGGKELVNS